MAPLPVTLTSNLLVVLSIVVSNVEVAQLVHVAVLVGGNDTQPVAHLCLIRNIGGVCERKDSVH